MWLLIMELIEFFMFFVLFIFGQTAGMFQFFVGGWGEGAVSEDFACATLPASPCFQSKIKVFVTLPS